MKRDRFERKVRAILGDNAPLHKWHPTKRGRWACRSPGCGAQSDTPDDLRACVARVQPQTLTQIMQLPSNVGAASGKRRELRTLEIILSLRTSNPAIVSARLATNEEDGRGIDIVVTTTFGTMFVQVKSSKDQARVWRKKYDATIGHKTVLVRWDGDRIVAPTNLREAIEETYMKITSTRETEVSA